MKLSEYFENSKSFILRVRDRASEHARLSAWLRDIERRAEADRCDVDDNPMCVSAAVEQLAEFEKMLDEGPPDDDGYVPKKEEPAQVKPRLPKGLMAKMREMCAEKPAYIGDVKHPDEVCEEAAIKAGLAIWTAYKSGNACRMFGKPEHVPVGASGAKKTPDASGSAATQETAEPAHCDACGWSGRTDLPLETFPPQGTCPKCGGAVMGDEPSGKGGAVLKAEEQARVALAGRIRSLDGWDKMLPSDVAVKLSGSLQAVRDAWPLLTGEKAQ